MEKHVYIKLTEEQLEVACKNSCKKCETKPESFSIIGAARELGISQSTIHRLINEGVINKTIIGKSPRIMKSEIDKFEAPSFK